jgi:hypothetical protein
MHEAEFAHSGRGFSHYARGSSRSRKITARYSNRRRSL